MGQLQKDLKEVRFELAQKEEALNMKIETIKGLAESVDQLKREKRSESERFKAQIQELKVSLA